MVLIKKYGNRRLYDSSRSRYINLEELAAMIRLGDEVLIQDARTGEDLTREVLLQVVMELLQGSEFLPTPMLRRIIRVSGDDPGQVLVRKQMAAGLELLYTQLDRLEAVLGLAGKGVPNPFAGPPPAAGTPPAGSPAQEPEPPPEPEAADAEVGVDELRARLDALEQRLKRG